MSEARERAGYFDLSGLDVELLSDAQAISVGLRPAAYRGEPGKAPRIGENGHWEIYDAETGEWRDTGVNAGGGGELSDYVKRDELTQTLSDYAPKSQLADYIPATERDGFATKEEIADFVTENALAPYAKAQDIADTYAEKSELEGYIPASKEQTFATKEDLSGYIPVAEKSDFATKGDLEGYIPTTKEAELATKAEVQAKADRPAHLTAPSPPRVGARAPRPTPFRSACRASGRTIARSLARICPPAWRTTRTC